MASWPRWRRMATVFEPIRPVPPMTTIFMQTVRKLPEFGVKQGEERAVRESERLGLIGRLTRPKRRPGPQCAQIEPRDPAQAATAAVMASTPRILSARRKL